MDQELVEPRKMEWAVLIEALIAGEASLDARDSPLRNLGWMSAPTEHRLDVLDLFLRSGQTREELLSVQKLRGKLIAVIIRPFQLLAELLEKQAFAFIESLHE